VGSFAGMDFESGWPKGCVNFETTDDLRFFHSSTEFVEPDTSRMNKLLSANGILSTRDADSAFAVIGAIRLETTVNKKTTRAFPTLL
jgi:hypothetical protein